MLHLLALAKAFEGSQKSLGLVSLERDPLKPQGGCPNRRADLLGKAWGRLARSGRPRQGTALKALDEQGWLADKLGIEMLPRMQLLT